jgi:uncharacterized membrane protein YczE
VTSAVVDPPRPAAPVSTRADASVTTHAMSRAGAIAAVLASAPAVRAMRFSARVGLLVAGALLIAAAVAVMLWTGLGPGPLDVFIGAVRVHTGLPLGVAVWLVVGSMILLSWALGRRPGPGTLVSPLIVGAAMQIVAGMLEPIGVPDSLLARLVIHVTAICVLGLGAGALIVSRLGAGSGELLSAATSDRTGRPEPRVRMAIELTWLAVGVALGGPIGLGTVIVALTIGPAVAVGYRFVDGAVVTTTQRSRAALVAAAA